MKADDLLQRERAAYLVPHADEVVRFINKQLSPMSKQQTSLIISGVIRDILHCAKTELIVQALDEEVEGRRWVFADKEDIAHCSDLSESIHMVVHKRVSGHCTQEIPID